MEVVTTEFRVCSCIYDEFQSEDYKYPYVDDVVVDLNIFMSDVHSYVY